VIEPSDLRAAKAAIILEDQVHLLTVAILKFIQLMLPLPPLSPMAQSRLGVTQILKEQAHPLTVAISKFIQPVLPLPPLSPLSDPKL
jgi:hypothetical protein